MYSKSFAVFIVIIILLLTGIFTNPISRNNNNENFLMQSDTPFPYIFCEGFTGSTFPPSGWQVIYTGYNYWSRASISGFCLGSGSAFIDFYNMPPGNQQLNSLIFQPTGLDDSLFFVDSYDPNSTSNDQLQIKSSTDGGQNWVNLVTLNGGLNGELVSCTSPPCGICVDWKFQKIALPVGTNRIQFNGISAWGTTLFLDSICVKSNLIGVKKVENSIPKSYELFQNYPNPFNSSTKIEYDLPKSITIRLTVYNVLGKEVKTLVNEKQNAGSYQVEFDGGNLPSGVYFYKLTAGDFTAVRKLVLLK